MTGVHGHKRLHRCEAVCRTEPVADDEHADEDGFAEKGAEVGYQSFTAD